MVGTKAVRSEQQNPDDHYMADVDEIQKTPALHYSLLIVKCGRPDLVVIVGTAVFRKQTKK